jgi:hypothetical protein
MKVRTVAMLLALAIGPAPSHAQGGSDAPVAASFEQLQCW